MGELVDQCTTSQKVAGILSMILSAIVMVLGFWWGSHNNSGKSGWLGGFNDCTLHAVLMLFGMCFAYTQAVTSYRVYHYFGHTFAKIIHGFWHTVCIAMVATALYYIIKFHNDQKWGHLSSMHSWLGLFLICIYFQNWLLGIIYFGLGSLVPSSLKQKYLPSHRFLGIIGLLLAAATMETGIAQKNWLDGSFGCIYSYTEDKHQNNPAEGYNEIGAGCRVAFGIGLLLLLNTITAVYSLWHFPYDAINKVEDSKIVMVNP